MVMERSGMWTVCALLFIKTEWFSSYIWIFLIFFPKFKQVGFSKYELESCQECNNIIHLVETKYTHRNAIQAYSTAFVSLCTLGDDLVGVQWEGLNGAFLSWLWTRCDVLERIMQPFSFELFHLAQRSGFISYFSLFKKKIDLEISWVLLRDFKD